MAEPQLADIARRFVALPPEKRRAFLEKAAAAGIDIADLPVPAGLAGADWSIASRAQRRLWFLWRLDPDDPAYNISGTVRLAGPLDRGALRDSLDTLVVRHDALRTRFRQREDGVEQHAAATLSIGLPFTDLTDHKPSARETALAETATAERDAPFDLETGPLLRLRLSRLAPDLHLLRLTIHHIVADGWSMGLLVDELAALYARHRDDAPPTPDARRFCYADHAAFEHLLLEAGACDARLVTRRGALADLDEDLSLPFDRPRPARPSHSGGSVRFEIDATDAAALARLAARERVSPLAAIVAAFALLLHRYCGGRANPALGIPYAGRDRAELENVVGFFVNMHVLRPPLRPDWSLARLARETHESLARAQAEDVPFDLLVDALRPSRDLSRNPLFQASVSHEMAPRARHAGGLLWTQEEEESGHCRFDLELTTIDHGGTLSGSLRYAEYLLDPTTAAAMAARFRDLLHVLLAQPDRLVGTVGLTGARTFAAADPPYATAGYESVVTLIEREAARRPEATAVHAELPLPFGVLVEKASRLARRLRAEGVAPGDIVGVALPRSPDLVVAFLAVLKAGAAYLPLDLAQPPQRLTAMLADAGAVLVVAGHDGPFAAAGLRVCGVDDPSPAIGDDVAAPIPLHPESLAYVITTSGSSGTPKGVAVAHGPLAMHCRAVNRLYAMREDDRELHLASIGFDIAHERWLAPLTAGASIAFGDARDDAVEAVIARLEADAITTLFLPPGYADALVDALRRDGERRRLRALIVGGEAWSRAGVEAARTALDVDLLINAYGPTETVIAPLAWQVPASGTSLSFPGLFAPIGFAVGARRALVLDGDLHAVPCGVVGELFVGGSGLARGYLGRAGLTAERFVPDPHGVPGARMYRTGDLASRQADGTVLYRGRVDAQVKVRGHRVEPGEVEARLREMAGVAAAAVVARPGPSGLRLLGYVAAQDGAAQDGVALDGSALREALARVLPDWMVPSHVMVLDRLPVTANGKLDRRALPEPAVEAAAGADAGMPATAAEVALAGIWGQVLGLERVSREADFFDLGGDSIVSLQVVSRARRAGLSLEPRDVFRHRSLAALAAAARPAATAPQAEPEAEGGPIPLLPIQAAFFAAPDGQARSDDDPADEGWRGHWNQAVLLDPHGLPDWPVVGRALQALVAHHAALRLRFTREGGAWVAEPGPVSDPDRDRDRLWLRRASGREEMSALCAQAQASLDLGAGRLVRGLGLDLADGGRRLLLVIHHLVVDGVSWRILLEDFARACGQLARGEAVALPGGAGDGGASVAAWARRLAACAGTRALAGELAYWLSREDAGDRAAALPCDRALGRPETMAEAGEELLVLDAATTTAVLGRGGAAYRTQANDLLLAGLARAVARWRASYAGAATDSNATDPLLIELEGHGREDLADAEMELAEDGVALAPLDVSRTVGWFTSAFPVLLPGGGLDDGGLIKAVKEVLRAIPRRGLGYGMLARLGPASARAALAAGPRPALVFNYLGRLDAGADDTGDRAPFSIAAEGAGRAQAAASPLERQVSVNAMVRDGCLRVSFGYGRGRHDAASVARLASLYGEALRELTAHCLSGASGPTPSDVPLCRLDQAELDQLALDWRQVEDLYPLTAMQQGLLFHALEAESLGADGQGLYLNQLSVAVSGLDGERLRGAWEAASARHPVLRTSLLREDVPASVPGGALQVVHRRVALPFAMEDWRGTGAPAPGSAEETDRLRAVAAAERARGFDLERAPLQRVRLVRLADAADGTRRHRLIWTSHHLILDGWSSAQLLSEVMARYRGAPARGAAGLYRDYVGWLAARQKTQDEASEAFWRARLAMLDGPCRLAEALEREATHTDREPERHAETAPGDSRRDLGQRELVVELDAAATARAQAFSRTHGLTLNTLVQGACALLLARFTGHHHVCFGATVSERPAELPRAEETLGLFISTLPVVVEARPDLAVADWLGTLQDLNLGLREHAHVPLARLQRLAGQAGQAPFDTLLVFENYPVDAALRGPRGEDSDKTGPETADPVFGEVAGVERANYPLMVSVAAGARLRLHLRARADAYGPHGLVLVGDTLAKLIAALADAPYTPVGRIAAAADTDAIVAPAPAGELALFPAAFARAARLRPQAQALVCGEGHGALGHGTSGDAILTYADLAARAERLARVLARRGIGPGMLVGLALPRTPALVVALVATLRSGAAYLPLDPAYPPDRLALMVADAAPALVLVQQDHIDETADDEALPPEARAALAATGTPLLALDAGGSSVADTEDSLALEDLAPESLAPESLAPERLAYVIYTSGSTGTPKGVMVPHGALANVLASMAATPGMTAADSVLALTSLSFDIAVLELLLPLTLGARIVLASRAAARDPRALVALARRHDVGVVQATPSTWRLVAASDGLADLPQACRRWSGGEALPADLARLLAGPTIGPGTPAPAAAWNLYGPTETTVWSACAPLPPRPHDDTAADTAADLAAEPPLGAPVAATTLRVLDADLHPAPAQLRGELFIGGAGLARGYLGRPALTAERFLPDPFGPPGARLYRTGDLACRRPDGTSDDGTLLYRGRADHQVKIRGHRIEPGEIEARLAACDGVAHAAVVARPSPAGSAGSSQAGLRLLAYAVPHPGAALDAATLRDALARSLPEPLRPARIVLLDKLPLTPNGKLDRNALPDHDDTGLTETPYAPPTTPMEIALADIWAHLLGQQRIGTNDDFFELGGDSIVSLQVISRARRAGFLLEARDVFRHRTLSALAAAARPVVHGPSGACSPTPSDVPLADLDQARLDGLDLDWRQIEDLYPLTAMQQGLLFHALEAGERGLYVNQLSATAWGLDADRLRAAWEAASRRHAVLRTAVLRHPSAPGGAFQVVHRRAALPFVVEDWRGSGAAQGMTHQTTYAAVGEGERLRAAAAAEREHGFDLERAPLQRVRLVRLADDAGESRHQLIWTSHHLILDGWSSARFVAEVMAHYRGEPASAPAGRYRDYVGWLAHRAKSDAAEAFWREALAKLDGPTRLAEAFELEENDAPVPDGGATRELMVELDAAVASRAQAFARASGLTLNTLVQGAWALLLARFTGQNHVCFGATMSERPADLPGAEEMLGLFIATLPVVVEVRPDLAVADWLRTIQDLNLSLREHGHVPLARLQRLAGRAGQAPFDTLLVFENYPIDAALRGQGTTRPRFGDVAGEERSNYPLMVSVVAGAGLRLHLQAHADAYGQQRLELVGEALARLIAALVEASDTPAGRISIVAASRFVPNPSSAAEPVHLAFARQARLRPDAEALVCGEQVVTYAELDARAERLARALAARGIGPGDIVGLALPRAPALVAAHLAVLRVGAAYLPLDPAYPAARLAEMLADAGCALLLTDAAGRAELPDLDCPILSPDAFVDAPAIDLPELPVHPEALAYIVYTSGSAGRPKGVAVAHGPLAMHIRAMAALTGTRATSRELLFLSLAFDGGQERLWIALSVGARIVLRDDSLWSPERTLTVLAKERCTNAEFPPAYLQELAAFAALRRAAPAMEVISFGGESMPRAGLAQVVDGLAARTLINAYGPTETVMTSLAWTVPPGPSALDFPGGAAPIGRAVGDRHAMVLDGDLHVVPDGVMRELFVGGGGLARGYLGRPGLTAERFVPDPFGAPGGRMYRTGDLACRQADGTMLYRGRADDQVKIRGFRIEPGEVEARLLALEGVAAAAVVARPGPTGLRLIGYAVPEPGKDAPPTGDGLREALARTLPEPMVPAKVMLLKRLPLTLVGKVDRRALPEPDAVAHAPRAAPGTPGEIALAAIWQRVLQIEAVGLDDDFFSLGGDSISALQVETRAREAGWLVRARDLFRHPRLDDLAATAQPLARGDGEEGDSKRGDGDRRRAALPRPSRSDIEVLGLDPATLEDVYPLSPMQEGMLFHALQEAGDGDDYVNQIRVTVTGLDAGRWRAAWEALGERHAILRTGFLWQTGDGTARQVVHRRLALPLIEEDWREDTCDDARLAQVAAEDHARGFDLAAPPLYRIRLIQLHDTPDGRPRHRLIWTLHHILIDGWSVAHLVSELQRYYQGQPLGPPPAPYRDHIAWLARQDASASEPFWRQRLAALDAPTRLAEAFGRPKSPHAGHGRIYTRLDATSTEALKTFARTERVTLNTLVQAAWTLLLRRYTGQDSVCFGATVSGRPAELPGSNDMVGLFINTLPRIESRPPDGPVGDWLRAIQDRNLELREHEQTPLAAIQGWAGQAGQALFDSIVVFENYPLQRNLGEGDALTFSDHDATDVTNYAMDLSVTVGETLCIEYLYLRNRFSDAEAGRIRETLEHLLFEIVADAGRRIGRLDLATPADRRLAELCNAHAAPCPSLPLVHETIAEQARRRPEAIALVVGDRQMSYGALEAASNRLAHRLRRESIGVEDRIGILAVREIDTFVAMLAVLKASAAYVPLDPRNPAERLAYMVGDAGIRLVMAAGREAPALDVPVLRLDALDLDAEPATSPNSGLAPDNLAYVIYTSGSTGQPKGVAVAHGPLSMHCRATGTLYEIDEECCELHILSLAFDGAHERWLTVLSHGGRLVVSDAALWTPQQIADTLHAQKATHLGMPPAYLQQLAEWIEAVGSPPPVKLYSFGGEAMPKAGFERIAAALAPDVLINGYGPTETVVTPLVWKVAASAACAAAYAPIGVPVGDRTAMVLDAELDFAAGGIAGELHVGGTGLARGYHGQPGATAERFVPDPHGASGARMYRTGDLARWDEDGIVEYLGRIDDQVKIRGFRIELGEVEARLRAQPHVREAAVVAQEAPEGSRLIGYIGVGGATQADDLAARVVAGLKAALPDYMVPAQVVVLARLPLTATGKVDRRSLPAPAWQAASHVAPKTEAEMTLARVWQDLLKVERVGITDNFFDLGGNSLLSLQVVSRLRREGFGIDIKLRDLMRNPTIAGLLETTAAAPPARMGETA